MDSGRQLNFNLATDWFDSESKEDKSLADEHVD